MHAGVPKLELEYAFTVRAELSAALVIGNGPAGLRRFVPITGGTFYFRTSALFEAPVGTEYEWTNRFVFVATAEREPSAAIIHFYRLL